MKLQKELLLLLCFILFSCTHKEEMLPAELCEEKAIMREYPDSVSDSKNRENAFDSLLETGRTFTEIDRYDSALYYFEHSLIIAREIGDLRLQGLAMGELGAVYDVLYAIHVKQGNYQEAIKYNEYSLFYADSSSRINHTHELSEIRSKYDYEKLRTINNELEVKKTKQERGGLIIIVFLLGLAFIYQYRLLRKKRSLLAAKKEILIFGKRIKENEIQIRENEALIASLYDRQSEVEKIRLNNKMLLEENKRLQDKIDQSSSLWSSQKIHLSDQIPYFDWLKSLKEAPFYLEEKDWSLIVNWTDLQYNHFIMRLKHDFPDFTDLDRQYCCLIKMGFPTSHISVFMNSTPNSVTKQKQRIKLRIKNSHLAPVTGNFSLDEYIKEY